MFIRPDLERYRSGCFASSDVNPKHCISQCVGSGSSGLPPVTGLNFGVTLELISNGRLPRHQADNQRTRHILKSSSVPLSRPLDPQRKCNCVSEHVVVKCFAVGSGYGFLLSVSLTIPFAQGEASPSERNRLLAAGSSLNHPRSRVAL
jgi:hypothetical protein